MSFLPLWIQWEHVSKDGQISSENTELNSVFKKTKLRSQQGEWTCPRSSPEGFRSRSPRGWTAGPLSQGCDLRGLDNTPGHFRRRFKRSQDAKNKIGASRGNERAVLNIWSCSCRAHVFLFKWNFLSVFENPGNRETWSHFYLYTCWEYKFTPSFWKSIQQYVSNIHSLWPYDSISQSSFQTSWIQYNKKLYKDTYQSTV